MSGIGTASNPPENEAVCRQKCKNGNEKMYAHGTKSNIPLPPVKAERADSTVIYV